MRSNVCKRSEEGKSATDQRTRSKLGAQTHLQMQTLSAPHRRNDPRSRDRINNGDPHRHRDFGPLVVEVKSPVIVAELSAEPFLRDGAVELDGEAEVRGEVGGLPPGQVEGVGCG